MAGLGVADEFHRYPLAPHDLKQRRVVACYFLLCGLDPLADPMARVLSKDVELTVWLLIDRAAIVRVQVPTP
jgi:hypothetical protein